jgi:hypothetical protein
MRLALVQKARSLKLRAFFVSSSRPVSLRQPVSLSAQVANFNGMIVCTTWQYVMPVILRKKYLAPPLDIICIYKYNYYRKKDI